MHGLLGYFLSRGPFDLAIIAGLVALIFGFLLVYAALPHEKPTKDGH